MQNSSGVLLLQPKPNGICIPQGAIAISIVKYS